MNDQGRGDKQPKLGVARGSSSFSGPRTRTDIEALVNPDERFTTIGSSSMRRTSSQRRVPRNSNTPARCNECKKTLSSKGNLNRHIRMCHGGERIYCQVPGCSNSFGQAHDLKRHMRRKHSS